MMMMMINREHTILSCTLAALRKHSRYLRRRGSLCFWVLRESPQARVVDGCVVAFQNRHPRSRDANSRRMTGQMAEEEDLNSLNWLRGFPSFACAHVTSTLTQDGGAVRRCVSSDTDNNDTENNNHNDEMARLDTAQRNELLLRKLDDEQSQMKSTLVAFRQWASDCHPCSAHPNRARGVCRAQKLRRTRRRSCACRPLLPSRQRITEH